MWMKLRRVWIQLTADRKRFGALCVVAAVGMLLWARLIVVSRMPRTAIADEKAQVNAGEKQPPEQAAPSPKPRPVNVELIALPNHDPFVISPRYFPRPTGTTETSQVVGKSPSKPAEDSYQIEARRTAALAANIERLRLEAAVTGSLVVINGKTFKVGESWVVNLADSRTSDESTTVRIRVREVNHRSAVLETEPLDWLGGESRQFEIHMASPGG